MKRTLKSLKAEALEHGITIIKSDFGFRFMNASLVCESWMDKIGTEWVGFTSQPQATGRKRGNKAEVMDWCLDWAINGF